ncbi:midasin AAA ATPase-domain containing protein isoform X2 [Pimephales promelas]|uniref:midasin AAA ATPase-domain containing protein isoform X2 n=1 Tax=Pimephales promelas TaxID=90988 RepID=UPI001955B590|nr:midasin AAA ATPase-domain containing protein isoform X2 [Pimephales promelas]
MPQLKRMAFPVDILTNVDHEFLELAAEEYMSQILYRNPDTAEYFRLPDSKQIEIGLCNVSFVPLYGTDTKKKLLALFLPDDFTTVVGLYLLGQWWGVEDVLKTAEPSRTGLIKVNTLGERIVLYVLNRIVLRNEKSSEDVSFLCHCEHESAKILWKDGEAIGFYSYKPKGSLCRNFLTQCYQLPVMDTIFVRKCHRGKGHGVEILEDFIGSFRKEYIGLKFPLSEAIYKVCEKYFSIHPADKEILWEVEKIGSPFQRTLIANRLQKLKLKEKDQVVSKLKFDEDAVISPMQIEMTKVQETIEYTVEIVEETITDITKEVDDVPVSRRGRGSSLKRRGIRENSEERLSKNIRVEDIEAGVESPIEVATEEHLDDTFTVKESETVLRSTTGTVTATVTNISELRSSQKEEEHEIEKDTATSEGTPVTHLTTAGEIESQRGSEEECEIVNVEHTVVKQGATIGSIDQNQLQSVVDIEIVKMSTGTEEEQNENLEKNKEVEEDKLVCETEEEEIKMLDEPEEEKAMSGTVEMYNNKKAVEEVTDQSETLANKAESESEVEEYREKEELTVDSTMDAEISQGETVDVVCEISEIDQEAPQQSSVESAEVHKWKTTPEEDQKTVENSSMMLTLSEAKVVLVDLHKVSPEEASDYYREIAEQDEMKHTMSSEQQAAEVIMIMEEQDGTLDITKGNNVGTDAKRTPEQATGYKEQEGEPETETIEVVVLSQVEKPEEETNTEQAKEDAQKKGSTDTPSRSTNRGDQTVDPSVTVRCLRSTLKQIKIAPVRRSTRSKAAIQQVECVEPQHKAKLRTDERDEVIAEDVGPEESDKANTNVDETMVIESGSVELLKATEEKTPQITESTEGDILLVEAEPDEDVKEKVKEIKKIDYKEANLAGQTNSDIEMSSLAQETDVQEEEVPVSTERNLRRRTIKVQSTLRRKSRRVQEAEADVEHQERHTVVTKNKTEAIPMTKETVEEIDQEVNKMENKEAKLAELEPVEETDMIRNEDEKTSASTEEIVNVCLPIITTETSFESLDDMANSNTVDTEKSDILMSVEIDQEKELDEETEIEDGTPVINLQKATVVLVDLKKLSQNTEEVGTPEVLKHSQLEEQLELDKPDKNADLCNLASEEEEQKEEIQTEEDTEIIPEEEKIEEENTVEEQEKLDEQDITFEEQKPIEDLATMPAKNNLVESTQKDINQNEDEGVSSLTEKTEIVQITEKSADKVDQGAEKEREKAPQKSTVEATENVIPYVEVEPKEAVVGKKAKEINKMENKETNLVVTKDTCDETPEMGEEANLEQEKNESLFKNEKEKAETEKPMEMDPVVSLEQTNARITRRSLRLSAKSVTSTQNTRKSTRLHKAELEPVKEADMSRNEYGETSATTERTVDVGIPIITVETNLESPDEIPNTNVEKTSAVGPEMSVLLMGVETDNEKEASKIVEAVTLVEEELDEKGEKDDVTPIIQLQKATVVLVDLNNLSQSTEGESDTPKVLTNSQTDEQLEQLELDEPDKSDYQLHIQTSEHKEQQEELQKEENTEKTPVEEEDKMEEENTAKEQNKLDEQIITFEQKKLTEVVDGQNYIKETEIVEDCKVVIDEDVEETVTSKEHPEQTTMADKANIIKETQNYQDVALKEKQTDSEVEMSSLAQETDVQEEEVPVSTERNLRRRTIKVQSQPRRKSRRVQNQEAEADVEHQERHTVVTKNKTEAIPMTKETVEEIDQEVNKMENKEAKLAELEPVEETDMIRNEDEKTSASTEEIVNVCLPIITTETSFESLDDMANSNTVETAAVDTEKSDILMSVEIDQEKEPDEETEIEDGTPVINLQKATVVLVDFNKISQNTEGESDTPKVLRNSPTEEQLELDEPYKSEYQLRIQTSEHKEQQEELQKEENMEKIPVEEEDKMEEENTAKEQNKFDEQIITFEQKKLTEVVKGQNDIKETEIVEECMAVIDEDVVETVTSKEHPEAATMANKANIIKETQNYQDVALKEKQTDSEVEMSSLAQEAPEAVQVNLEEEVPVSTERSLRRRKIKVQSPPRRKSRRVQNQEAEADVEHQERHTENKTEAISMTDETVEEIDQEVNMKNDETCLAELEPVEEDTENVVPLVEGEPDATAEKGFEEIDKMENKEQSLENDPAPEMGREEANLEQHENESLVSVVCKEQTYLIEETTSQVEEVSQMKISETNDNKTERITRRSLRISAQPATSTQKTRTSTRPHTEELEPVKEADRSRNEETSSTTVETVSVCVPIIAVETNMESLNDDVDMVFMSRNVETTSYEQEKDISNDKGKVDEALLDKSTNEQEDETKSSIKTIENEILLEMDKTQKDVEGGVQDEEKKEPQQENADQKPEENTQQKGEDEARTSSVEEEAVSKEESSDQEASFITRRSLRYRTVTVQSTPRRKSNRLHRQEVASEKETMGNICGNENDSAIQKSADDLNIEKENEALNAEESITEFENLKTKEGEGIIQVNMEGKAEEKGTKDDTVKEGNEILFEINESNSACPDNTEQDKTREENLERDVQAPKELEEEEVSSVQAEKKPVLEKETEGAVQGSSFDLEETTVERRTLRKRLTVKTAAPRKSKRLRKQEHDEDSEQVKEVIQQTETVEVTFTTENVEPTSDVPAAAFEGSNLGGGTQQKIQENAEGTKSDGDCNIHEDTKTDAGESQKEHKEKRVNKPKTDEDNDEVMEQNSRKVEEIGELEEVIDQHVEAEEQKGESSTNEGFTLELEVEETPDQEENKAEEDSRVATDAAKDIIFTSAEKSDEGEENEKGLPIEKHVLQSSSSISSSRRRSMRLQMHESRKGDESDSEESEEQQTAKQRKRKAITDLTPARRSKRYRAKIV